MRSFRICNLHHYYLGDEIMEDEMDGHVARMDEMRSVYKTSVGKPEGEGLFGRPRRR
jgi:hypothetical protein